MESTGTALDWPRLGAIEARYLYDDLLLSVPFLSKLIITIAYGHGY